MTRSARQSKILEIIAQKEIETQDELARELRAMDFDITQATISRDIKELGLIKIMTDSKRYKYAVVETTTPIISNKFSTILREAVISVRAINNLVVLKTLKGLSQAISGIIDKLGYEMVIGSVFGDETVMVICESNSDATLTYTKIQNLLSE